MGEQEKVPIMSFGDSTHVCPKRQQALGQRGAVLSEHSAWPVQGHCGNRCTLQGSFLPV